MGAEDSVTTPHVAVPFTRALLAPKYWLTWVGLFIAAVLGQMPVSVRHRLGVWVGDYLCRKSGKRYGYARANLKQVFPNDTDAQIEERVKSHLQWYGKGLVDYSRFFFGFKKALFSQVSIQGQDYLDQALSEKQAVILLLTHSVMLEFAAVALASQGVHSFGSYKQSKNAVLDWVIARSRCRFVDFVVSREEGLRPLVRAIQSKRVMIFLPDEDLGLENGVFAPFFARQKATLTTPARLTKLGKAVALAGLVHFDQVTKQYVLNIQPLSADYPSGDAAQDATEMNQSFENLVRLAPEQYMWLLRLYLTTHPDDQSLY